MIIVQKYGGTSVADVNRIKNVAGRIAKEKNKGTSIVVVVSALGNTTNELLAMASQISKSPSSRELDMLLSAGERISASLLSMAIEELNVSAVSLTGSQAGIITDNSHTKARIVDINSQRIKDELEKDKVVIVAGFQGVSHEKNITTLGRGGSDLTAVALAASLNADMCEIFTDVDGIFTADPSIVSDSRKIAYISYDEMLELSASGAQVMQTRSVEFAKNNDVKLHVRSSFNTLNGTIIEKESELLESSIVTGVAYDETEAKFTILKVPDRPGIAASVFGALARHNINVDMIIQNVSSENHTDITFTLPKSDLENAKKILAEVDKKINAEGYVFDKNIAKVSLVGAGMKTSPGIAAKMFEILSKESINIQMISTSTIKISVVVSENEGPKAVKALHKAFELESKN